MNLTSLKDDPFLNALHKSVKLDWDIKRHWDSGYVDLDTYSIYDSVGQLIFDKISYDKFISILSK